MFNVGCEIIPTYDLNGKASFLILKLNWNWCTVRIRLICGITCDVNLIS